MCIRTMNLTWLSCIFVLIYIYVYLAWSLLFWMLAGFSMQFVQEVPASYNYLSACCTFLQLSPQTKSERSERANRSEEGWKKSWPHFCRCQCWSIWKEKKHRCRCELAHQREGKQGGGGAEVRPSMQIALLAGAECVSWACKRIIKYLAWLERGGGSQGPKKKTQKKRTVPKTTQVTLWIANAA